MRPYEKHAQKLVFRTCKETAAKKNRFCVGGVFGRRAFSLFSFFSMSDCRAGFFVEALRNIVRSFRVKGSEMVWEKPKETQKWSGGSPGRVKPNKNSEMVWEKPRSPKNSEMVAVKRSQGWPFNRIRAFEGFGGQMEGFR